MIFPSIPAINYPQAELFDASYFAEKYFVDSGYRPSEMTPKMERTCRFCNKKYPDVTFRKDAHIIPELFGSNHLVSDFECDDCNYKAGKFEDDLAKFLGISRTLQNVRAKEKIPVFKSVDQRLRAGLSTFANIPGIEISSSDDLINPIAFDYASGKGLVIAKKQSYRPLNVYKAFVKMALCCIDDFDKKYYQPAIDYVFSKKLDNTLIGASHLLAYHISLHTSWKSVFAILFRKKDKQEKIPTHLFVLFTQERIYQIFIPLNINDLNFYNCGSIEVPRFPPIVQDLNFVESLKIYDADFDLSSKELARGEEEKINFQIAKEDLGRLVKYNMNTKKIEKSNEFPSTIRKILLVKPGFVLDLNDEEIKKNLATRSK